MPDFSHLKKLDINSEKEVSFKFIQIEGEPTFNVVAATESNKPFYNELLRRAKRQSRVIQAGAVNAAFVEQNREEDRVLYAKYVIRGWKDVKDAQGKVVPFNQENCLGFLKSLPGDIFDDLRAFCSTTSNFREEDDQAVQEKAKN